MAANWKKFQSSSKNANNDSDLGVLSNQTFKLMGNISPIKDRTSEYQTIYQTLPSQQNQPLKFLSLTKLDEDTENTTQKFVQKLDVNVEEAQVAKVVSQMS